MTKLPNREAILAAFNRLSEGEPEALDPTFQWLFHALGRELDELVTNGTIPAEGHEAVVESIARLAMVIVAGMPEGFEPKPLLAPLPDVIVQELARVGSPLDPLLNAEHAKRRGLIHDWAFTRKGPQNGAIDIQMTPPAAEIFVQARAPKRVS